MAYLGPLSRHPLRTLADIARLRSDWLSVGVTLRLADSDVTALAPQVALLRALAAAGRTLLPSAELPHRATLRVTTLTDDARRDVTATLRRRLA